MIEYIKGNIAELTPTYACIEAHGVGYMLHISLNTYSDIHGVPDTKLWVYEAIKEDAYTLYGFSKRDERTLFVLLISVSGVGASTARMILSAMTTSELERTISMGDVDSLKSVKGIGLKTAQRIIVDLKGKISGALETDTASPALTPSQASTNSVAQEALAALCMLGFNQSASQKTINSILAGNPSAGVEQVIKLALQML